MHVAVWIVLIIALLLIVFGIFILTQNSPTTTGDAVQKCRIEQNQHLYYAERDLSLYLHLLREYILNIAQEHKNAPALREQVIMQVKMAARNLSRATGKPENSQLSDALIQEVMAIESAVVSSKSELMNTVKKAISNTALTIKELYGEEAGNKWTARTAGILDMIQDAKHKASLASLHTLMTKALHDVYVFIDGIRRTCSLN